MGYKGMRSQRRWGGGHGEALHLCNLCTSYHTRGQGRGRRKEGWTELIPVTAHIIISSFVLVIAVESWLMDKKANEKHCSLLLKVPFFPALPCHSTIIPHYTSPASALYIRVLYIPYYTSPASALYNR